MPVGPVAREEMSEEDRALLENPAAMGVWELLAERYPDRRLAPETSPQLDLGIDSLGWVNLTLEIGEKTGVELREEAIGRIDTVRDLLREVASGAGRTTHRASPLERPEEVLDDRQLRWLKPLGPAASVVARGMFLLNRAIMRGLFRLRVEGLENLPDEGQFIIAPNHVSYLDAFAVAAALHQACCGARTGPAGRARPSATRWPVSSAASRRWSPSIPSRAGLSSLAFGAAVLAARSEPRLVRRGRTFTDGKPATVQARRGHAVGSLPGAGRARVYSWHVRGHAEGAVLAQVGACHGHLRRAVRPPRPEGDAGTREQVVEAVRGRVLELGQRR